MDDFPSNAHSDRKPGDTEPRKPKTTEKSPPEKKVSRVVTQGSAQRRRKPLTKRFRETFTGDDSRGVWDYVVFDVLVPAAKDMMADATSLGMERLLFGESRSRSRRHSSSSGYVSYNRMSNSSSSSRPPWESEPRREMSRRGRSSHDFDEIILTDRGDAEQVIDTLMELVSKYDVATVADLYELTDVPGKYTDQNWGWTDLRGAGITRVRNGYLLDLPRPEHIK